MSPPNREDLLGYLLGALERREHERIEEQLVQNPQLRQELAALSRWVDGMGLSDKSDHLEPPTGLAARTCQMVTLEQSDDISVDAPLPMGVAALETRNQFSLADFLVAAAVMAAAVSLFFPALASSRFKANVASCQNRLRQIGFAIGNYDEIHGNYPSVQLVGNRTTAGVVAPILADAKFVSDPRLFLCPTSKLAGNPDGWKVPTLDELDRATGSTLDRYQQTMGGSFAYNMGYLDGGKLRPASNEGRNYYAMLADAPSDAHPQRRTVNHGGQGQNVLFEDGHIEFLKSLPSPKLSDDPFYNRDGIVAAGTDRDDSVLGNSGDRPLPVDWISETDR